MLRRCIRDGRGQGVDEPTTGGDSDDERTHLDPVVRRLSQLAGVGRVAPSLSPAPASAPAADAGAGSPPSFLVNLSAASPNAHATAVPPQEGASFSSTPTLVRLTSARALGGSASAAAAAAPPAPAPAPAPAPGLDILPDERRLVWTQSKSRREAWLLQEAKLVGLLQDGGGGGGGRGMPGVREGEEAAAATAAAAAAEGVNGEPEAAGCSSGNSGDNDGDETEDGDGDPASFGGDGPYGSREDRRRLRARLSRLGLARQRCDGDGNCLFRAVSAQLYGGSQAHHAAVRAAAVRRMLDRHGEYEAFLGEDFGAYIAGMSLDGSWGDELVLRAVSDALGVVAHVVTSDAEAWYHVYEPEKPQRPPPEREQEREQEQERERERTPEEGPAPAPQEQQQPPPEIFLAYLAPVHYDSLVPARHQQHGEQQQQEQEQEQQQHQGLVDCP